MEFWRDQQMDNIIEFIVNLFHMDGVELVRIHGLATYVTNNFNKNLSYKDLQIIIEKLAKANIIQYNCKLICPHCGEIFYMIKKPENNSKMCDTCKSFFKFLKNNTYFGNLLTE